MAFTLGPFIIASKHERENDIIMNHERIHLAQWKELLYIGFFICYFGYSFYLLVKHLSFVLAYKLNIFEIEAYTNEKNMKYLKSRKKFSWLNKDKTTQAYIDLVNKRVEVTIPERFGVILLISMIISIVCAIVHTLVM